ncbi:cell envelope integrity protein TolA [Oleiphilus sp. HI0123]|uniref:cell envelope integrity protein TolA n=1 Tax=Oleiphilus sp. HI0123 TaxID=1822265 RepID=UPI000A560735|nr:cell envelope integrity protein TolA [Oleiphilus sp. HI0123]
MARQAQEKVLLEKMRKLEEDRLLEAKAAEEKARQAELEATHAFEVSEVERFMAAIKRKVQTRWRIPPKSTGLSVTLTIELLPSGELKAVGIKSTSGNPVYDRSAEHAASSISTYPVPDDVNIFDRHFRKFSMRFSPVD